MSFRNTLFVICLIISVLCLAVGYGLAGHWMGAIAASLVGPAWWLARNIRVHHYRSFVYWYLLVWLYTEGCSDLHLY